MKETVFQTLPGCHSLEEINSTLSLSWSSSKDWPKAAKDSSQGFLMIVSGKGSKKEKKTKRAVFTFVQLGGSAVAQSLGHFSRFPPRGCQEIKWNWE